MGKKEYQSIQINISQKNENERRANEVKLLNQNCAFAQLNRNNKK